MAPPMQDTENGDPRPPTSTWCVPSARPSHDSWVGLTQCPSSQTVPAWHISEFSVCKQFICSQVTPWNPRTQRHSNLATCGDIAEILSLQVPPFKHGDEKHHWFMQVSEHSAEEAFEFRSPESHSSPASRTESPQRAGLQSGRHALPPAATECQVLFASPPSHCSKFLKSVTPFPQQERVSEHTGGRFA